MKNTMNSISLELDDNSEYIIEYENNHEGILCLLKIEKEFGFSNISAYLSDMLQRLNSREVIFTFENNQIKIEENPKEKVFEIYYTDNNSCGISDEDTKKICKIGSDDACIFCSVSVKGFECQKFDPHYARIFLYRLKEKTIRANRIGNCKINGRKS